MNVDPPVADPRAPLKITRVGTFTGSWTEICGFCGEPQSAHRITYSLPDGELLEQRRPCNPERDGIEREYRIRARTARLIHFVGWVFLPLLILLINEIQFVSQLAFATAVAKLIWEGLKIYGNPEKWFPAYGRHMERKREEELRKRHFIYHCERNPEGFARLRDENFRKERAEKREC